MRPITLISLLFPAVAAAAQPETICPLVGGGLIQVDGLLDDWPAVRPVTKGAADARDAAVAVRCAYDETTLFVAVDVTDDRLIRSKKGRAAQDRLVLSLGDARLELLPASGEVPLVARWLDVKKGPPLEVADSLQKAGFSIELSLPLARVPGWSRGAPAVPAELWFHDADQHTANRIEDVVATGPLLLVFEAAARTLQAFLAEVGARRSDLTLDELADLDGEPGLERVVVAGKTLGVLSEGYAFLALPVASPRDLLSVQVVDLGGAGKSSVVVRYREHGGGGSRDVVAVWILRAGGFARIFAHEIAKQVGGARLTNRAELVPRGKGKRGHDLVIQIGEVVGFSEATWNETPASDMVPIMLPWGDRTQAVWRFDNDEVSGG
jgi:hypothetical protein